MFSYLVSLGRYTVSNSTLIACILLSVQCIPSSIYGQNIEQSCGLITDANRYHSKNTRTIGMPLVPCGPCQRNQIDKDELSDVVVELFDIGAIKFGNFTLKSGKASSFYIDLRRVISYPQLLNRMCDLMWKKIAYVPFDAVCGVPYAALALCSGISMHYDQPMLMVRKEAKAHGTKQMIEGVYHAGQKILLIEDVITTGGSIAATAETLASEGLTVEDAVVFVDREEYGVENLAVQGIRTHSVIRISDLFSILSQAGRLKTEDSDQPSYQSQPLNKQLTYLERAEIAAHPVSKKLLRLMEEKQTNLALAADVKSKDQLLELADQVGPYICILKTHVDILEDFDEAVIEELQQLAQKHRFIIFEDRKFADIGNTAKMQYEGGMYKISSWAQLTTVHSIAGPGLIRALSKTSQCGILLLPQLSSQGALTDGSYARKTVHLAKQHADCVVGFIARKRLIKDPRFIFLTPGVSIEESSDQFGQQYLSPQEAITCNHTDIIIVGRGIYQASDPEYAAKLYRLAGWKAYLERIAKN